MLESSPVFGYESHISLTLLAVVTKKGGSGRTVTNRLFGLHSLAIPFELYLNASQGANPAYVAIFELFIASATFTAIAKLSTESI